MHEMAVAASLLKIITSTSLANGGYPIQSAQLAVGALSCVNVDCLQFGFEALARGTLAEGCTLEVRRVPIAIRCRGCNAEAELPGDTDSIVLVCPTCASRDVELVHGRELDLETIRIDD